MAEEQKKTKFQQQAEMLIQKIEAGTAPWQKPWQGSIAEIPMNPITGNQYKGGNAVFLMAAGETDPRWMTYKQALAVGAQVQGGAAGMPVVYWKFDEVRDKVDAQGNKTLDSNGKPERETVKLERPQAWWSTVFNAKDIEGLPPLPITEQTEQERWEAIERAERALELSGVNIQYHTLNKALYRPYEDKILLPDPSQFMSREGYYQVALHELGHATGHESRLDRDILNAYGTEKYAREELVAEMASMFVGMRTGVGSTPSDNSASYIASWVEAIKNDPKAILKAASAAEKACEYIMAPVRQYELEHDLHYDENSQEYMFNASSAEKMEEQRHEKRQYIDVPYKEKDQAREADAKWDKAANSWYIPNGVDPEKLKQWPMKDITKSAAAEKNVAVPDEQPVITSVNKRTYIDVPYKEKDQARTAGAKWDRDVQAWYIPNDAQKENFSQWRKIERPPEKEPRHYISVPYDEKDQAKEAGAKWDKAANSWYIPEGVDVKPFVKWEISERKLETTPALSPREEFAIFLKDHGCTFDSSEPYMDGPKSHRIAVEGDKGNEKSGFYVAYADGHPAGYFKNNRTSEEVNWKSHGQYISADQKQEAIEQSKQKQQQRTEEASIKQAAALKSLNGVLEHSMPIKAAESQNSYIEKKGINANCRDGVYLTTNTDLCVPGINIKGELQTAQYIKDDGTKVFAKNCMMAGAFHVVNAERGQELQAIEKSNCIVVAEGYATAASLQSVADNINIQAVAAYSAGNLKRVAMDLREQYPDKPILIAGDDDYAAKVNVGKISATEAAECVGAAVIFPHFSHEDVLENDEKGLNDFNDVLLKSENGSEKLKQQLKEGVLAAKVEYNKADIKNIINNNNKNKHQHQEGTTIKGPEIPEQQEKRKSRSR